MNLYFSYFIFLILIIANRLFLFNEEFLILVCFCAFCLSIYFKSGPSVELWFKNTTENNRRSILESINIVHKNLQHKRNVNIRVSKFKYLFIYLKNHYKTFVKSFIANLLTYLNNLEKKSISDKLIQFKRIEAEYVRFVFILINKKLLSIGILIHFFTNILVTKRFVSLNKVEKLVALKKI